MANIYDAITRAEALRHRSFCDSRSAEIITQLVQFLDRFQSPDPAQTISLLSLQLGNRENDLARVRGLLQRQWISVEERLPDGLNEFWCWIIPLPVDECPCNTSGDPITPNLNWSKPHADIVSTYKTKNGLIRFNCGGLEKVTHWMPRPDPPTFPQSSSLAPSGAESADIGKLDSMDKSARANYESLKGLSAYVIGQKECGNPATLKDLREYRSWKNMPQDTKFDQALLEEINGRGSAETGGEKA